MRETFRTGFCLRNDVSEGSRLISAVCGKGSMGRRKWERNARAEAHGCKTAVYDLIRRV